MKMPDEVYDILVERHVNDLLLIKRVETLLQQARLRPAEAAKYASMALGLIEGRETLAYAVLRELRRFLREECSTHSPAQTRAFLMWLPNPDRED